jgi:hypothetical protein
MEKEESKEVARFDPTRYQKREPSTHSLISAAALRSLRLSVIICLYLRLEECQPLFLWHSDFWLCAVACHPGGYPTTRCLPPLRLGNSPRLNDLANRSNGYLTSNRFLLTTGLVGATIWYEIGAAANASVWSPAFPALPFAQACSRRSTPFVLTTTYPSPRGVRIAFPASALF